jgi:hypothetical protein
MARANLSAAAALARTLAVAAACAIGPACHSVPLDPPVLATANVAGDFEDYRITRVGLLPFEGRDLAPGADCELQAALAAELAYATPYELVELGPADLHELRRSEPHRRGGYDPQTIIGLARRYRLDALLFGTVLQEQDFPPLRLALAIELVATDTGAVVWSGEVQLDANDERVRDGLEAYYASDKDSGQPPWELALVSPGRFRRFAAWQLASVL